MKNNVNSIVFGVAIIIASVILGNAYLKRSEIQGEISVTGLGEENFESDLITWSASFSNMNLDLKQASSGLKSNRKLISEYIVSKGISEDLIIFSSVNMDKKTRSVYSSEGEFMGS